MLPPPYVCPYSYTPVHQQRTSPLALTIPAPCHTMCLDYHHAFHAFNSRLMCDSLASTTPIYSDATSTCPPPTMGAIGEPSTFNSPPVRRPQTETNNVSRQHHRVAHHFQDKVISSTSRLTHHLKLEERPPRHEEERRGGTSIPRPLPPPLLRSRDTSR